MSEYGFSNILAHQQFLKDCQLNNHDHDDGDHLGIAIRPDYLLIVEDNTAVSLLSFLLEFLLMSYGSYHVVSCS